MGRCPKPRIRHVAEGRGKNTPTPLPERIFSASRQGQGERRIFWKSDQKNPSALTGFRVSETFRACFGTCCLSCV